jgi:glucose/mannose transport system permease protein
MQENNIIFLKQLEQKSKYTNMFLRWFLYFVLIFCIYFIFPLYVMIVTSFKTMEEIRQGNLLLGQVV